jgi:hypothetical protein
VRTRYISQGDWFRLERDGSEYTPERVICMDRVRSFDGETTRVQNETDGVMRGVTIVVPGRRAERR